ncbi:unnamed protein product [Cladocopium goreaui]|uniref:Nephrocystin-3 n=1 Tax=Cladocopium goreaui TaxID=2562237 RepID=A0A9P1BLZ7_9DINO|nr:unnamed protein product [Cladocopium goreaui]
MEAGNGGYATGQTDWWKDFRYGVEKILRSSLAESKVSKGVLQRESWIRFLQIIGGTEEQARALLKDQGSHLSVENFLDLIFGDAASSKVSKGNGHTLTNNLRDYFENHYREGGQFGHADYIGTDNAEMWTWLHKPTGIQVWQDAIDLTSGHGGEVYFHYTSELAFRNITHPAKEAAEVWASLKTDGPNANAWWGKGIYTVPLPPDQWQNREQLLDNNFRNMMRRDREDPERGPEYVDREYPKRAAFCVPILIDACNAFDVSKKATPEMEAAGKEPGRNLADKLLNEPGMPPRWCVVLRVYGEDGVQHARGRLLDALRARANSAATSVLSAKYRLGCVLHYQGLTQEALPLVRKLLASCESIYGPAHEETSACAGLLALLLQARGNYSEAEKLLRPALEGCRWGLNQQALKYSYQLAYLLTEMCNYSEAVVLYRRVLDEQIRQIGSEHPETLTAMSGLATVLKAMGHYRESADLRRTAKVTCEKILGPEHPQTLDCINDLAIALHNAGDYHEAAELYRKVWDIKERTFGPLHPVTLHSLTNLAITLTDMGNHREGVELHRRALDARERTLGLENPETLQSMSQLALALHAMGNLSEAEELQRRALCAKERILGPQHPSTLRSIERLVRLLKDMGNESEAAELWKRIELLP